MSERLATREHPYRVGFSGTRRGLRWSQEQDLRERLKEIANRHGLNGLTEFHHGLCIGADEEAHKIAHLIGFTIIGHPGPPGQFRADYLFERCHRVMPEKGHFARNRAIVELCDILIAVPPPLKDGQRAGGTWYTIAQAEKRQKPRLVWESGGFVERLVDDRG